MDLRIHSPSSLGYIGIEGIDSAPALVRLARVKGIDVIGITDFYSGTYIDRVAAAAVGSDVRVIPGVTLRCRVGSCDDVILCALFPEGSPSTFIESVLQALEVPLAMRGNESFLLPVTIEKIINVVEDMGGVLFPSRMDKTPHRVAVIPELVEEYGFRTFDLAYLDSVRVFKKQWPKKKFNLFSFSEAHALAQVGSRVAKIKLPAMNFDALSQVLQREETGTTPLIIEQTEIVSLTE